jgi:predicted transcriptional regulator
LDLGPIEEEKRQKRFLKLDTLAPDFRDNAQQMGKEELNTKIAEVAKLEQANQEAKKADPKISKAKEEMKNLTAPYREDSKAHKLMTEFLVWVAESKGWA